MTPWIKTAATVALAAALAGPAAAQERDTDRPRKEDRREDAHKDAPDSPGEMIERLRRELADLEAASGQRRAELMRRLAEAEARMQQDRRRADHGERDTRDLPNWMRMFASQEPEWVIGIMTDERGEQGDRPGILIQHVPDDTPAAKAGLKPGDVIVAANGIRLRDRGALVHIIQAAQDQPLRLTVQRDVFSDRGGDELELTVRATRQEPPAEGDRRRGPQQGPWIAPFTPGQSWPQDVPFYTPGQQRQMQEMQKQMQQMREMLEKLGRQMQEMKTE